MPEDAPDDETTFSRPSAEELPRLIEALLFVSDGPVAEAALTRALGVQRAELNAAINALAERLQGRGTRVVRGPEGVQLVTAPDTAAAVEHFLGLEASRRLSPAALETLAVVSYRQPVTRAAVEAIRGVNSDASIATLRARGLIDIGGRADGPGRPLLFVTTQRFLEHFGLEHLDQLPELPELPDPAAASGAEPAAVVEPGEEITPEDGAENVEASRSADLDSPETKAPDPLPAGAPSAWVVPGAPGTLTRLTGFARRLVEAGPNRTLLPAAPAQLRLPPGPEAGAALGG